MCLYIVTINVKSNVGESISKIVNLRTRQLFTKLENHALKIIF